jgi:hypothetical protein
VRGKLHIETPDVKASAWLLMSPFVSYEKKQEVIRHLFGSHEAHWAVHWDGWYPARFVRTLERLGFSITSVRTTKWGRLRNVEIFAEKGTQRYEVEDYRLAARDLLALSTVKSQSGSSRSMIISASEEELLKVWMEIWEKTYLAKA